MGLFALIAQFILMLQNRQAAIGETIIRFFSFFTILTNTLVMLYFANKVFPKQRLLSFLDHKGSFTSTTVFILIVGLVYQFVLRSIWEPQGLQLIVDEMLHSIVPFYFLIYWAVYSEQSDFKYASTLRWLLYPVVYAIFVFIRGALSGFYPYPFLNVSEIGYAQALINVLFIFAIALLLLGLLTFIGRKLKFKKS